MAGKPTADHIKPFLRWAGGKQWLAQKLRSIVLKNGCTYYEPFLGGGSVFFAARPRKAVLGDSNADLIRTYQVVRDHVEELIGVLSGWENEEETYYQVRAAQYADPIHQAARLIYLNKTCWNGLYRVNREGQFNVPFGRNGRSVFDRDELTRASGALQDAQVIHSDFEGLLKKAAKGDFVYLDPPYTVLHSRNGFRQYNEKLFSWDDQTRLAATARKLATRGCSVVVSNANSEEIQQLYPGFLHETLSRSSVLAADPTRRRKVDEALLVSRADLFPPMSKE